MQRWKIAAIILVSTLAASAGERRYMLTADPDDVPRLASRYGLEIVKPLTTGQYLVKGSDSVGVGIVLDMVRQDPAVANFEADPDLKVAESQPGMAVAPTVSSFAPLLASSGTVSFFGSTVRAAYPLQPALALIRAGECQLQGLTGAGTVAVIDTGVDPNHPALNGVLAPGYDFTRDRSGIPSELDDLDPAVAAALSQSTVAILDQGSTPSILNQSTVAILDQSTVAILDSGIPAAFGHGTMVAGLVHAVAPSARIMPLKAFKSDGSAHLSDIVSAIYYAADHGATVINMSFSMTASSLELMQAIQYAVSKNVLCVASAGNGGKELLAYPAAFRRVIGVGSTNLQDRRSLFSNYGDSNARTAAPGEWLVTTYPGNHYASVSGTSFSAALVAGAVTVFEQVKPKLDYGDVMDVLEKGKEIGQELGDARLDVAASAASLQQH